MTQDTATGTIAPETITEQVRERYARGPTGASWGRRLLLRRLLLRHRRSRDEQPV